MTWVKKKNTPEEDRFWSHVESVAERVRTSEIYSNNRVPLEGSQNHIERRLCSSHLTSQDSSRDFPYSLALPRPHAAAHWRDFVVSILPQAKPCSNPPPSVPSPAEKHDHA
jgi:hypothetical protein